MFLTQLFGKQQTYNDIVNILCKYVNNYAMC